VTATAALPVFDMSVLALSSATPPFVHPTALALIGNHGRAAVATGGRALTPA